MEVMKPGEPGWVRNWSRAIEADYEQYMSGQISEAEYRARVHERDELAKHMTTERRRLANTGGAVHRHEL